MGEDSKMNNEPVAWMKTLPDGTIYGFGQTKTNDEFDIPLYTHPAKTLTDGEILNMYLEQTNGNKDLDILEFARAILKKASEK
jgi:hypothetical protein